MSQCGSPGSEFSGTGPRREGPGPAPERDVPSRPADWQRISYKGGSESGVMNLTTWLVAKDGKSFCVSATWNNDKPLEETKFFGLYKSLLANLQT